MPCPACRSPVADDQRYCLDCGLRLGAPRVDWRALLAPPPAVGAPRPPESAGLVLPTPRVAATLLLTVMGFGVALANVAASDPPAAVAAAARPSMRIVLPPTPAPAPPAEAPPAPEPAPRPAPEPPAAAVGPSSVPDERRTPPRAEKDEPILADEEPVPDVPEIRHVFLVALGPGTYEQWFGEGSAVPYLRELAARGTLLAGYRDVGDGELANLLALVGGRLPTPETKANCPSFCELGPADFSLSDQLVALGHTWKAYVEGQDAPGADPPSCRHPAAGEADPYHAPGRPGDPYVTWRNPFVYFSTVTTGAECATADVGLTPLATDLADAETTATFTYVAPAPEHSGPATADSWLREVLPAILGSPAYADDGLLIVVPDVSGDPADPVTGALLLSDDHVAVGAIDTTAYDHFSTLRSIEDLLRLRPLGEAERAKSFVSPLLH